MIPDREPCVLVVEDDQTTRTKLSGYLETAGYRVLEARDGRDMWDLLSREAADVILLDINLPGEDGLELTRQLRRNSDTGIILVTGRTDDVDRIVGLEIGADDYVTKPFNPRELLARVKGLLRRATPTPISESVTRIFAGWKFDLSTRKLASPSGEENSLTRAEYELLKAFVENPRSVMNRDRLLDSVTHRKWDRSDRTIDVLVRRLRQKIEADPKKPEIIVTAHGEGYIFTPVVEEV